MKSFINLVISNLNSKIQAGDLVKIAKTLRVPISVFFEDGRGAVTVSATDHSLAAGRDFHGVCFVLSRIFEKIQGDASRCRPAGI